MADTGQVSRSDLAEMEQYLGPSTLAKLQVDEIDEDVDEMTYADDDDSRSEDDTDDDVEIGDEVDVDEDYVNCAAVDDSDDAEVTMTRIRKSSELRQPELARAKDIGRSSQSRG